MKILVRSQKFKFPDKSGIESVLNVGFEMT